MTEDDRHRVVRRRLVRLIELVKAAEAEGRDEFNAVEKAEVSAHFAALPPSMRQELHDEFTTWAMAT